MLRKHRRGLHTKSNHTIITLNEIDALVRYPEANSDLTNGTQFIYLLDTHHL